MRIGLSLIGVVFAAASCLGQNTGSVHIGSIQAKVTDADGAPVQGAIVTFRAISRGKPTGFLANCISDQFGSCANRELPFSAYSISAANPKSGYPDMTTSFYAGSHVLDKSVTISAKDPSKDVDLHMGKQAGVLDFSVADASSGKPLNAKVELRWVSDKKNAFGCDCMNAGQRRLLIPSNVAVTMVVSLSGYEDWTYSLGTGEFRDAILLRPGEELSLDIRMWSKQ